MSYNSLMHNNKQKGFMVALLITIIAILAIGLAVYIHNKSKSSPAAVASSLNSIPTPPSYIISQLVNLNAQVVQKSPSFSPVILRVQIQHLILQYTQLIPYISSNYPALMPYVSAPASTTRSK